jgi:threonine dehydrogenase-like Zn-dependent dehydrogenase
VRLQRPYCGRQLVCGSKPVTLGLGRRFHRERIKIISSQVSTINPELSGRWDHSRRFDIALDLITRISPEKLITHTFGFDRAHSTYRLLDTAPETAVQIVLSYVD